VTVTPLGYSDERHAIEAAGLKIAAQAKTVAAVLMRPLTPALSGKGKLARHARLRMA